MQLIKILWASDGSKESDEALKYLGLLSGSYTFHTIGLGVIRPFHVDHIQIPTGIKKELSQIELEQRKRGYERIEEALSKLGLNNKLSTRIETGMPHELFLKVAEEENVDLIVWKPIVEALKNLEKGGRLVINAIRKEDVDKEYLLKLDYSLHLWHEKEIKSVANVTRRDVSDFLEIAADIPIKPEIQEFSLEEANQALRELKEGKIRGAKVLRID